MDKKKKRSHRNEKLKANRASVTEEQRKEMPRIRRENKKTENHEKQCLPTLKRWKRGDDNELESNQRLEKVVSSKQLRLAMETEKEIRARLENDVATEWLRLVMESGKDGSYHTAQVGPGSRGRRSAKNEFGLIWI